MHLSSRFEIIISLQATDVHGIVLSGYYVYYSNYNHAQLRNDGKYDSLFDITKTCLEIVKQKKVTRYHIGLVMY